MTDLLFDALAWICALAAIFWLLDRIEHAWLTISGQQERESRFLAHYAASLYLAADLRP